MPVRTLTRTFGNDADAYALRDRLIAEWRNPSGQGQPLIMEEGGGVRPLHLYVVWDEWEHVEQIQRSEIIMDAFTQVHGAEQALNVTVAMGLTPAEARKLGIADR